MINTFRFFTFILLLISIQLTAQTKKNFEALDVFQLEYANDPQISPDGNTIVYRRTGFDIMKDGRAYSDAGCHSNTPSSHSLLSSFLRTFKESLVWGKLCHDMVSHHFSLVKRQALFSCHQEFHQTGTQMFEHL